MKNKMLILFILLPMFALCQVGAFKVPLSDQEWRFVGGEGLSAGDVWSTSVALSPSGEPWIAYQDGADSSRATVMRYDGTNWVYVGDQGFSPVPSVLTSLKFKSTGEPVVMILDQNLYLTAMQFNGSSWEFIGNTPFSPQAGSLSFALDASDTLYVVFENGAYDALSCMKFDGSQWVFVGPHPFISYAMYPSMAIDSSGVPYVAFTDNYNHGGTTVMRYTGSGWEYVGAPGFTTSDTFNKSIKFSPSGQLYVASDGWGYRARLQKLSGNLWMDVGTPGISAGSLDYIRLAFEPSGEPCIAYEDRVNGYKATLKKYTGTWVDVGQPGFSPGETDCESLVISESGVPFVAFVDYADSGKATVMMFDYPTGMNGKKGSFVKLYPDPAFNQIHLEVPSDGNQNNTVLIYNVTGNKVFEKAFPGNEITLSIENFPPGIYMVMVKTEKSTYEAKFCKK